jgi:S-adenosylmethionine:tRNA ribosyltransferase-isomerase
MRATRSSSDCVTSPIVHLDEFDYELPTELIAQEAIEPRDAARLMVDRGDGPPDHRCVRDLADILEPGDLLVVNDSRVIPARLRLRRMSGAAVEVLLLEPTSRGAHDSGVAGTWEALVRPGRKVRPGEVLLGEDGSDVAIVRGRAQAGDTFVVDIVVDSLDVHGEMPLPPYITTPLDRPERYQTVYARRPASAAAPTAGLHLTDDLLGRLAERGVELAKVELVVGLDTFRPVTEDDPTRHPIHSEAYSVPAEVLERCRDAKRVVAVGTTAVRALETAASTGRLMGRSELFVHRGFEWRVVDLLMTNFHLPRTTLLLLIDAFVGPRWRRLYETAIAERYRFLSFGDAMLLDRHAATTGVS